MQSRINSTINVPCGLIGGTELAIELDPTTEHEYLTEFTGHNHSAFLPLNYRLTPLPHRIAVAN